jgi:Concanavalin A-like lectin/glucanases superfamily
MLVVSVLLGSFVVGSPSAQASPPAVTFRPVCPGPVVAAARCHADVRTDEGGNPLVSGSPTGYGPTQFRTAYGLPSAAPSPQTIGIVDAYDSPTIENDLTVYNQAYGLSPCTTANGCFQKVNQSGSSGPYPRKDSGWALEIALDVEVAHAVCPNCKILLVEANSNLFSDLAASVDTAASLGATVISNSYGGSEFSAETDAAYDGHFNHPGIPITVSSGDNGYGVEYPAASPYVTAVGGTTLALNPNNTRGSETAWSGSGSGCSAYEQKPSWQADTGCSHRTVADVSADADPATGASVYDSTRYQGQSGWFTVGGTSLSSPLVAAAYALAANADYRSAVLGSSPIGYWRVDDTSGTTAVPAAGSVAGSYVSSPALGAPGLLVGDKDSAVGLNGGGQYLDLGDNFDFAGSAAFTIELWAKLSAVDSSFRRVFSKEEWNPLRQGYEAAVQDGGPGVSTRLFFDRVSSGVTNSINTTGTFQPQVGVPYDLVFTFDGSTMSIYVNGQLKASGPSSVAMTGNSAPLEFGSISWGGEYLAGTLDEPALYGWALTPSEILAHYRAGVGTTYGSYPYMHAASLFDITAGSNGSCGGSYLCTARAGYDGPTGLGAPNGLGGF